ncbi:hypothetical protein SDC9_192805 [bioreactor metagenome]|uniref:Uncharacterized protein n=1 Tax=bioreactor metagenome TaxID=1076179 RepID=A0A645I1X0_9ZZZZ
MICTVILSIYFHLLDILKKMILGLFGHFIVSLCIQGNAVIRMNVKNGKANV